MKSEYFLFQCIHTRQFVSALMCQRKTNKHVRVHAAHAYPLSLCNPPSSPRRTPSSHLDPHSRSSAVFFSRGFRLTVTCCNLAAAYLEAVDTFPDSANFSTEYLFLGNNFSESFRTLHRALDFHTSVGGHDDFKGHSRVSAELEKKVQCWVFDCLKSFFFFYLTEERTCICRPATASLLAGDSGGLNPSWNKRFACRQHRY